MENMFRTKKNKDVAVKKAQDVVSGTLDSIHQSLVSSLKNSNTEELRARRAMLMEHMEDGTTIESILRASRIESEIRAIDDVLGQRNPLESYYVKNADIMLKYYGAQDKVTSVSSIGAADQHTFLKYLHQTTAPEQVGISKKELFEQYTSRMKLNAAPPKDQRVVSEHCDTCNVAREEHSEEGVLVCPSCGSEEHMMVVSDFPSFRDPPKERNNYAYKKINHLNEILNQFQAKESTIIPDDVMHEVVCEIKKRRIQNVAELTEKDMREILKKLNRSKYYEHATHILSRLNGNPPPTITPEIEEKIRAMFQEIQAPFLLYCPNDRTNFLSYSYILYKFFELLELDEYKVYFPLLKSRDRLIAHDEIWKKICEYLRWEFIQSV